MRATTFGINEGVKEMEQHFQDLGQQLCSQQEYYFNYLFD